MSKTCMQLMEGIQCRIEGNPDVAVEGLCIGSRDVLPGFAFFCIKGMVTDGHKYAQDAVNRGASVIVAQHDLDLEGADQVTLVVVDDTRMAAAQAAANFYDQPSSKFQLVGITGTNGKTTTTYLVDHLVQSWGKVCGIIGTTGNRIGTVMEHAERTTPDSVELQGLFDRMAKAGCQVVAMEVSSHALDLRRTWASRFAVTAFTNLTQDHLDYHHTFEAYFEAKARLFSDDYPATRVICIDDEWGQKLAARCVQAGHKVLTTGFSEEATLHPVSIEYFDDRTEVRLMVGQEELSLTYPLVGRFNVSNMMTAFGIGLALGMQAQDIALWLADAPGVPGRLQRISSDLKPGVSAYVDYAHTPDALEKVIGSIRSLNPKRLLVVFGCGGDRDATKRPIMGKAALAGDFAIVTSDNPRTEDPQAIIDDIVAGMGPAGSDYIVEIDRKAAIYKAVSMAEPGDAILIAGKGHEDYQILGTQTIHFDDREVVACALEGKE